jgi:hypothetical protein
VIVVRYCRFGRQQKEMIVTEGVTDWGRGQRGRQMLTDGAPGANVTLTFVLDGLYRVDTQYK